MCLPDDIITQRADAEGTEEEAAAEGSDQQDEDAEREGRPRRRRAARLPEAPTEPEEKLRGKRQKDFDAAEQNASSDEEGHRRERSRSSEQPWTQSQQKLLELALQQYPKGSSDRWDRIAKCVPSKSKVGAAGAGGLHTGVGTPPPAGAAPAPRASPVPSVRPESELDPGTAARLLGTGSSGCPQRPGPGRAAGPLLTECGSHHHTPSGGDVPVTGDARGGQRGPDHRRPRAVTHAAHGRTT